MNPLPPGLLLALASLWGYESGFLPLGVLLGATLDASRLSRARLHLSIPQLDSLWNLCAALFFTVAAFLIVSTQSNANLSQWFSSSPSHPASPQPSQAIIRLLQWFPLVLYPMMLAQIWGAHEKIPVSVFSWFLRKSSQRPIPPPSEFTLNVSWIYAGALLAGASAGNPAPLFLPSLFAIATLALLNSRSHRFSILTWIASLALILAAAYFTQISWRTLYSKLQNWEARWLALALQNRFDANESRTWIGQVGHRKSSSQIAFRIQLPPNQPAPPLLREAAFDRFNRTVWNNANATEFAALTPDAADDAWPLSRPLGKNITTNAHRLRIFLSIPNEKSLLPLPSGSFRLQNLPALSLETNRFGAARLSGLPWASFDALYHPATRRESPPSDTDLELPASEIPALQRAAREMNLHTNISTDRILSTLNQFFTQNFSYSLYQPAPHTATNATTALDRFLHQTRSGHCEYFATATTLLLRHAGIPARYAVGWSLPESSSSLVPVRARNAHAWTLAWIQGRWIDIDNTPGSWQQIESDAAPWFQPIRDFFSRLNFEFQRLRYSATHLRLWLLLPALGLLLFTLARFLGPLLRKRSARATPTPATSPPQGLDSELLLLQPLLAQLGLPRSPSTSWSEWEQTLSSIAPDPIRRLPWRPLLQLHEQYRFDPNGLTPSQRSELARQAHAIRSALESSPPSR